MFYFLQCTKWMWLLIKLPLSANEKERSQLVARLSKIETASKRKEKEELSTLEQNSHTHPRILEVEENKWKRPVQSFAHVQFYWARPPHLCSNVFKKFFKTYFWTKFLLLLGSRATQVRVLKKEIFHTHVKS